MAKKIITIILSSLVLCALAGNALADNEYPKMHLDDQALKQWVQEYENAPKAFIDPAVGERLQTLSGDVYSVLGHISYDPSERNQGYCGNCWVWAGTGILEVALSTQAGVKDRLSEQYLNSCYSDRYACNGGNLTRFADFYSGVNRSVPWSNQGASYQDGSKACGTASSSCVSCSSISTGKNYRVDSISAETITTRDVGAATAIDNIKNVLRQNRGVWIEIHWPNSASSNEFSTFWNQYGENSAYNPDHLNGMSITKHSGHAMLVVGYDDSDRTWIVLNSWGTNSGARPNGTLKVSMDLNYDCALSYQYGTLPIISFQTLAVTISAQCGDGGGGDHSGITGFGVWANNLYCVDGSTFGFAGSVDGGQNWLYSYTYYGYASTWDGWYGWPAGRKTINYAYGCGVWQYQGYGYATLNENSCYTLLPYFDSFGEFSIGLFYAGYCTSGSTSEPAGEGSLVGGPTAPHEIIPLERTDELRIPLALSPPEPLQ